jgi:UDP-N-acetylglucosamine 2-epimerase (non-hydrolysing)
MTGFQAKTLSAADLEPRTCVIVGTRPGIVMFSPIIRALEKRRIPFFVLHTGQHYSYTMDRRLFEDLELPEPDYKLEATQQETLHGAQTGEMLAGCERILLRERPGLVLVGGDANTNLAGALAARKLHIQVAHVEAGERSYDWRMPEEHNRVLIDHMSEYLLATNEKARENLVADGVRGRIVVTGNPIVDATLQNAPIAGGRATIQQTLGLEHKSYFVLTLHREENVDSPDILGDVLEGLRRIRRSFLHRIVFAAHPRTRNRLHEFGLLERASSIDGLVVSEALGYLDFLSLIAHADVVLTDSGGVQQESCILGVPCVTLRESTEWTETVDIGANVLAGTNPKRVVASLREMTGAARKWSNPFGDGRSSERIVDVIEDALGLRAFDHGRTSPRAMVVR